MGAVFLIIAVSGVFAIISSVSDNEPGCFPIGLVMIAIGAGGYAVVH